MKGIRRWLVAVVLCVSVSFVSRVFADRITIESGTTYAEIDGEYGEEGTTAYGVYVEHDTTLVLTFTEDAEGVVSGANEGSATAYGVYTTRETNTIDHQGNMEVVVVISYDAYVYGVYAYSSAYNIGSGGNISLTNSGNISATGTGGSEVYVYGVYAYSYAYSPMEPPTSEGGNVILTNSGDIAITGTGDYVEVYGVSASSEAWTYFYSVPANCSGGNITLDNSGNISATGTG
ncbi:MAG: hypothetical protein NC824_04340, partial [Candidatus Omnitrophica bacterium]|nr:hypothetical protein [Candidatus Omnitrophota bacterium]